MQYFKQAWNLIRQEKLFSAIYIIGTGLSITMVMTLSIIFYIRMADIYPETNRNRMLIVKNLQEILSDDSSSATISWQFAETCLLPLASAEAVSLVYRYTDGDNYVQPEESAAQLQVTVRYVDEMFWRVFPFHFLSGKPFDQAERESGIPVAVIASSLAKRLFGEDDAVGRYVSLNFRPYRVCGVVRDASYLTERSYAQLWIPYTLTDYRRSYGETGSLGPLAAYILTPSAGEIDRVREEILENFRRYASQFDQAELNFLGQPDRHWQSTFRYWSNVEPDFAGELLLYGLIFFLLLAVPAVGLSGMTGSRIERRLAEMGVRRAFGATRGILAAQIVAENFLFTLLGGGLGLLFSYMLVFAGRNWIMELGAQLVTIPPEGTEAFLSPSMLLNLPVFGITLAVCFLLNLFSALVPAVKAARAPIIRSLNA
jgi:putative ABC transport system permease protein